MLPVPSETPPGENVGKDLRNELDAAGVFRRCHD